MKRLFLSLALLLFSSGLWAQIFTIRVVDYDGTDSVPGVKNFIDSRLLEFQNEVNDNLPSGIPDRIMEGMANATSFAGKGVGSDYASYMQVWLVGASAGAGADLDRPERTNSDISGVGVAPGAIFGMNLRHLGVSKFAGLDAKRVNAYVNFMNFGQTFDLYHKDGIDSDAKLGSTALGFKFRYDWIDGSGDPMLGWGGIKLHWGYEYNRTTITLDNNINRLLSETNGQESLNGRVVGNPKYKIEIETHSMPLEISTDVRFLNFLTLFGGLGTDLNVGKARGRGQLDADVSPVLCTGGGVCGAGRLIQVQVEANLDADGQVYLSTLRGFAGLQLNLPYFRLYGQISKALGNDLIGANVGVRFVY